MSIRDCTDKLVGLAAIGGWGLTAAATNGGALAAVAEPVSGGIILASSLAMQLRQSGNETCAKALEKARGEVERETRKSLEENVEYRDSVQQVFADLNDHLPSIRPTIADLVDKWLLDPNIIATELLKRFVGLSEIARSNHVARQIVETTISRAIQAVKDDN